MSSGSWAGAALRSAVSVKLAAMRQIVALGVLCLVTCSLLLAPIAAPEPITVLVLAAAIVALAVEAGVIAVERVRIIEQADALIEQGFVCDDRGDPTSRAVAARVAYLQSATFRLMLAKRWRDMVHLSLRDQPPVQYPRPYIGYATIRRNASVLEDIVAKLESGPCDPAATVRLWRALLYPPLPCGLAEEQLATQAQFSETLIGIAGSLELQDGRQLAPESATQGSAHAGMP